MSDQYDIHAVLEEPCLEWNGCRDRKGYGKVGRRLRGKMFYLAHRYYYALRVGDIPEGMVIDHLCRNPACINVSHLEPVTQRTNVLRGVGVGAKFAARTSCANGHPYGDNPPLRADGGRRCIECERDMERRRVR